MREPTRSSRPALPVRLRRAALLAILLALAALCLWQLEQARDGVQITRLSVGDTPVTRFAQAGAEGPVVVVAHGFAGSTQMMQGYTLSLARAGYRVYGFDWSGHGRNPVPMSGDVGSVEGTTRLLVGETLRVIDAVADGPAPVALLGHSMATDLLVRTAAEAPERVGPVVLISAFSQAITPEHPRDLLLITGAAEPRLRRFALEALRMLDPDADEGQTVAQGGLMRRAVVAPGVDHVAVLHSATGAAEARDWLNRAHGRSDAPPPVRMGGWFLALMAVLALLAHPLARLLPASAPRDLPGLTTRQSLAVVALPALAAPLVAVPLQTDLLPVLVADYLALHLGIHGAIQLALLARFGQPFRPVAPPALVAGVALLVWALLVFGAALDRYGANFWPTGPRLAIIAALALGAVPFMLADAMVVRGAGIWRRIAVRAGFLASLGLAVALDPGGLFFLALIAPVIVLFYLIFGTMGRAVAARAGAVPAGAALGLVLAWALGVSFPLFATGGVQ